MIKNGLMLTNDMALLGLEAQQVIGMRLMRIAAGGKGARFENERMVTEKIAAAHEAAMTLMTGGSPEKIVRRYRPPVKKNKPRLARHKVREEGRGVRPTSAIRGLEARKPAPESGSLMSLALVGPSLTPL